MVLAGAQHWIVTFAELLALGFSPSAISRLVAAGRLHRLHKGVYAVGRPTVSATGRRLAAVLACGPDALLSHFSNAAHLGLRKSAATLIDVTVPRRSARRRFGIRIHRRGTLISEDRTVVDGIPCTSLAWTLLDLAPLTDDRGLERMVEQAEILQIYDHRQVERLMGRSAGRPGVRRLVRVLGLARPGKTLSRSELEEALLRICRRGGLPEPELNQSILLGGVHTEVDFLWRAERVVVEVDSWRYHRQRGQFRRDRRRDQCLELEGWSHARFTDDEVAGEQRHVEAVIRQLLTRARVAG
jgi:very-short-patch-repair endonuclease